MTSFYYYDQNSSGFCFPVQIAAFVVYTSMGSPNLNMKGKTKRILVVEVKWRNRASGLLLRKPTQSLSHPPRLLLFSFALNQDVFQIPSYVIGIKASRLLTFNSRMTWTVCHFLSSKRSPLFMYSSNGALGCGPKVSTSFMNPSTNIKAITSGRPLLAPDKDKKKRRTFWGIH